MNFKSLIINKRDQYILKYGSNDAVIELFRSRGVKIGNDCLIARNTSFGSEPYLITIGNHVRVAMNVTFNTHDGGLWVIRELYPEYAQADKFGEIVIGNNCHIGWGATILPNVHIGDNVIIGAEAVVTKDVPSNSVVAGVPARHIENIDEYLSKTKPFFVNTKCMSAEEKKAFLTGETMKKSL